MHAAGSQQTRRRVSFVNLRGLSGGCLLPWRETKTLQSPRIGGMMNSIEVSYGHETPSRYHHAQDHTWGRIHRPAFRRWQCTDLHSWLPHTLVLCRIRCRAGSRRRNSARSAAPNQFRSKQAALDSHRSRAWYSEDSSKNEMAQVASDRGRFGLIRPARSRQLWDFLAPV